MLASANNDIGPYSHSLQLFYAGLGRLCLHFLGSLQIRDQGHMDQNSIFMSDLMLELADRL